MSNNLVNELYASNKQLNIKINNISSKIENDNKNMITLLNEINTNLKNLVEQNQNILDKINNIQGSDEKKDFFLNNKLSIDKSLQELNNIN